MKRKRGARNSISSKLGTSEEVLDSSGKRVVVAESKGISRRATLFLSGASFLLSLMFLSQNITGNVVANFSTNGANWIGVIFFILAITGFLVYTQKGKEK